jgi:hypothetical protein
VQPPSASLLEGILGVVEVSAGLCVMGTTVDPLHAIGDVYLPADATLA